MKKQKEYWSKFKFLCEEFGFFFLAMLSIQPLAWKILGLVDWAWKAVLIAPAIILLIAIITTIYCLISVYYDYYKMGISIWDLLNRIYTYKNADDHSSNNS